MGVGVGLGVSPVFGMGRAVSQFFVNALGVAVPSATPTYTGASSGRFVPDEEGIFVAQAGLVNALGQAIPPVAGGNIAAGPALIAGGSNEALMFSAARTNKVTARKRNPTDTTNVSVNGGSVTVVDSSAALAAAGLGTICNTGKVYSFTSDGTLRDCTFAATAGNTNIHSVSAYVRVVSGSGGRVRLSGVGETLFTNTSFQRVTFTGTALTTSACVVRAEANSTVEIILPGLFEANSAPYYPVVDATDGLNAVTLAASDLSYPVASIPPLGLANGFQFRARFTPRALPGTDQWLWSVSSVGGLYIKGADNKLYFKFGASEVGTASALVRDTTYRVGCKLTIDDGFISLNGTTATNAAMSHGSWAGSPMAIGEKGDNSQYLTGEFNKNAENKFFEFRDTADANWFSNGSF